jgi:hypothetical protein
MFNIIMETSHLKLCDLFLQFYARQVKALVIDATDDDDN